MRPLAVGIAVLALMANAAQAGAAQAGARQACNVQVDITDMDPKGTNLRATPSGAIVATLQTSGEGWIEAHIVEQDGDWFEVDSADYIGAGDEENKSLFRGKGYLHKSVIGVGGMVNGGVIYSDHDGKSRPVDAHAAGDQKVDVLGCWEGFLKVHTAKGTGWTKEACLNMNTTCS